MAIKSVVVHPKGATHFQKLSLSLYFLGCFDGIWLFWSRSCNRWIQDPELNDTSVKVRELGRSRLQSIR